MQNAEHFTFEIFSRSNQDTCLSQRPLVKQGQWVAKGQPLADCVNSVSGDLALGKNVLVAYMPWEGYNFEDSIVISDRLIAEDVYTSIHILRFKTEILNTNSNVTTKLATQQDSKNVSSFDALEIKGSSFLRSSRADQSETRVQHSHGRKNKQNLAPGNTFGEASVKPRAKLGTKPGESHKKYINNNNFGLERRTRDVPFLGSNLLSHLDNNGIAKVGTWVSPGDVLVGKVRPLANKFKSNRASTQLAWEIISSRKNELMTMEDRSFRLPKGVSGRIIKTEILKHLSGEQIHVYLAVKRKIQIGDKLAGRHGNKGIVSLVLPRQDMPYLADGTPIDIVLSPLGVPSRMNVGQIYECLLGLAAKSLICDFKVDNTMQTLSNFRSLEKSTPFFPGSGKDDALASDPFAFAFLPCLARDTEGNQESHRITGEKMKGKTRNKRAPVNTISNFVQSKQLTNKKFSLVSSETNSLLKFSSTLEARNLVFLKLYHSRITRQSKGLFSLTHPGKMRLFDGRTSQPFANWITVGYAYMLKLIHLVDNKIHSRSTGPYSLITRQPVTGKARHGGQRVGEMEAWAIEGFGAAYTLQEFFSFKGDDVSSRNQWQVTNISQLVGNTTAFKRLFTELRALCVSMDFTGYINS